MSIFVFKTANPERQVTVIAADRKEADAKFDQMRDAAGLTQESTVVSVREQEVTSNIVEHPAEQSAPQEGNESAQEQ